MTRLPRLIVSLLCLACLPLLAQNVPTCTVNNDTVTPDCSGSTWLPHPTSCQHKTITCQPFGSITFAPIGITFGYKNPAGGVTPNGTIVFFSEGGGKTTDDPPSDDPGSASKTYAAYYNGSPYYYQVVQTAWDSDGPDWEDTTGTNSAPDTKNVAYAAGRPAAFLSWAISNLYDPIQSLNSQAGMCVQGTSAGGAAAIYSLAWYGLFQYIDKVELLSSPPLSNINAGCSQNPTLGESVPVCPTGQLGCNATNDPSSWTQSPSYTDQVASVRTWTGDIIGDANSCRPTNGGYTSGTADARWQAESIVDGTVGTFNYPHTQITSWLCSSSSDQPMNNSSPQAQLFFQQFTNSSQYWGLVINGVVGCQPTDESVGGGTPPLNYQMLGYGTNDGQGAIEYDMTQDPINLCTSHHNN